MKKFLKDYLNHIQMESNYASKNIPCEICGDTHTTLIRETISIGKGAYGKLPVVACNTCGFLFQNPRFDKKFYQDYYALQYRKVIYGKVIPPPDFVTDQINRGQFLYNSIHHLLPKTGTLLDVGSSVGGMMKAFMERGWDALGTDPDTNFVNFGRNELGLPVIPVSAEEMDLKNQKFDLILIMGSLEHVFDPNKTLEICRAAAKPGSLLLLEGRGHPQSASKNYFNHNHHRYFTLNSIELMMMKFGWQPFLTTDDPLCGPTRPGSIYSIGRLGSQPSTEEFIAKILGGKRDLVSSVLDLFNQLDRKWDSV